MPLYLIRRNLTIDMEEGLFLLKKHRVHGLHMLSQESIGTLIAKRKIRQLDTPDWSYFDPTREYDIIMGDLGVKTMGDFAGLNPDDIPDEFRDLQKEVIDLLNPYSDSTLEDCCGESPGSIPELSEENA